MRAGDVGQGMTESVRVFLSAVSDEFRAYRDQLRGDLTRHNVEVKVQEDFKDLGGVTLEKLDEYIKRCDAVVHLAGDMTGAAARELSTKAILGRYSDLPQKLPPLGEALGEGVPISYTQWEAWLALYHGKVLLIAQADKDAPRGPAYAATDSSRAAQKDRLARLRRVERYPGSSTFTSPDNLAKQIAYTTILDLLAKTRAEAPPRKPRNLPFASLGTLFKGRDKFLEELHDSLSKTGDGHAAAVIGKALHGLGGIGKTRLAIEYAWRHEGDYSALLFVPAETPERLAAGLAALAGPDILDLPEKEAREDMVKIAAALKWLDDHPGWHMILDNVDNEKAAAAVEELVAKLKCGDVLITGRTGDFSAAVETFELDVLNVNDAASLLLESTAKRDKTPNDAALAHELARELGGLALALAQTGAYINRQRIGFSRYLNLWREKRETVVSWFDRRLVSYNHDVGLAATWVTSVEQLTPGGRRLLELLAFFAPEPVPESLLDVAIPGDGQDFDARDARADLFAYSLAARVTAAEGRSGGPAFAIHRLVQEFTRRRLDEAKSKEVLAEALGWVNAGFTGNPQDVRSWPTLDPLAPHALALAQRADEAGIPEPTAWLMNQIGVLFRAKSRYAEAESLTRRALAIAEKSFGPDHPNVASCLNNLAGLLKDTNRLADAEPLMRRALAIDEKSFGPDHPNVAIRLNNLACLLQDTNRLFEAEPLMRRALAIDEKSFGPDHPNVAIDLNNLASLLQDTNRLSEAEPLYRRALAIDEKSLGPDHPKVANDLNNLATLLCYTTRLAEAEPLMRRHLEIFLTFTARTGHEHPHLRAAFENYAGLLRAMGRSEAEIRAAIGTLIRAHGLRQ
jgi:tetratricopeptide (TPR) repeat protein